VQVYTHPLWMFLLCGTYGLTREAFFTTIALSMVCTLAVLVVAWRRWQATPHKVLALALLLVASKAFTDFSTSGLENPMTHLIATTFFVVLLDAETKGFTSRRLLALIAIASLGYVNRADTILASAPALVWMTWRERKRGRRLVGPWALGLLPAIAWTAFSIIYYGFPFPNTAYAKLAGGHYHAPFFHPNGLAYFVNSLRWDPLTLPVIAAGFSFGAIRFKTRPFLLPVLAGVALLLAYVLRIGGDYMSGRFFALPFLLSALVLVELLPSRSPLPALALTTVIAGVGLCGPRSPLRRVTMEMRERDATMIMDDRAYHRLGALDRVLGDGDLLIGHARLATYHPTQAEVWGATGYFGFLRGPGWRTIDNLALSDPLLARLPARDPERGWGRGHLFRAVPAGYIASVSTAENRIVDPSLHEYYDKLLIVTTGPIFTMERFRTIWRMNTGAYAGLIEQYVQRNGR
jgi:arabinofuranosyltransferase